MLYVRNEGTDDVIEEFDYERGETDDEGGVYFSSEAYMDEENDEESICLPLDREGIDWWEGGTVRIVSHAVERGYDALYTDETGVEWVPAHDGLVMPINDNRVRGVVTQTGFIRPV